MVSSQSTNAPRLLRLAVQDNIAVATATIEEGAALPVENAGTIRLLKQIAVGHKVALRNIAPGEKIIKFGCPIGSATQAIRAGEHVHTHNLKSDYLPTFTLDSDRKFVKD